MKDSYFIKPQLLESVIDENISRLELLATDNVPVKEFIKYSKKYSVARYMKEYNQVNNDPYKLGLCLLKVVDFTTKYFSKKKCYPDRRLICIGNILFKE